MTARMGSLVAGWTAGAMIIVILDRWSVGGFHLAPAVIDALIEGSAALNLVATVCFALSREWR